MPTLYIDIAIFLFGMCVGSFMNVCIYRLPGSQSISNPRRSICPRCDAPIAYYDNIPVISYILLRGRCRSCTGAIDLRYPLVEMMGGFFALCAVLRFGLTIEGFITYVFICSLIVITHIDIDHQIIPDVITLPGIPIFFLASFFLSTVTVTDAAIGVLAGGGSLLLVAWGYQLIKKKEGMGGGDIKLLAMIGAFLGLKLTLMTFFVASVLAATLGVTLILLRIKERGELIPFGPYLAVGAMLSLMYGERLVMLYLAFGEGMYDLTHALFSAVSG